MPKKTIDQKIDELAQITKHGFDHVDEQFKVVDKRFDEMNNRFDKLEYLITGHDRRIEILEDHMRQVAVKVGLKFN